MPAAKPSADAARDECALQDKKSWLTALIDEERETALSIKL